MNYSNFLLMGQEIGLVIIFVILFLYDVFCSKTVRKYFQFTALLSFTILTIYGFFHQLTGEAFGGMYFNSLLTVWMKNMLNIATLIILLQSHQWLSSKEIVHKQGEFYTIILVTLLGMYLMISAGNFMMLYIGLEMASLPLACLTIFNKNDKKSSEAGMKYILISAFSSGVMLFGISLLYGSFGTVYFTEIKLENLTSPFVVLGFVFFLSGLCFKLSLVPFHLWTADVYEGSPTNVTAYLSVVSKSAAAFVLIFSLCRVFGHIKVIWQPILYGLSIITITVGNLFAIRQKNIKRFFAFSSISQAGYILISVIPGTAQGMTAMVYFLLVYAFSNLAAFGVISSVEYQMKGDVQISAFYGLYQSNPILAFIMMLAVFSLGGIPPFSGFFSKFFIFMAAIEQGQYVLVFIALLNTIISLYYYLLIVKAMFILKQESQETIAKFQIGYYNLFSLTVCMIGIFGAGILSCVYGYIGRLVGFVFS